MSVLETITIDGETHKLPSGNVHTGDPSGTVPSNMQTLYDNDDNPICPITSAKAVFDDDGTPITEKIPEPIDIYVDGSTLTITKEPGIHDASIFNTCLLNITGTIGTKEE